MSYHSFKRVLGETNLERKCRFLFGACLLLLISGSFFWYGQQTEQLVEEQNLNKGALLVDTVITRIHWEKTISPNFRLLAEKLPDQFSNTDYLASFIREGVRPPGAASAGNTSTRLAPTPGRAPSNLPQHPLDQNPSSPQQPGHEPSRSSPPTERTPVEGTPEGNPPGSLPQDSRNPGTQRSPSARPNSFGRRLPGQDLTNQNPQSQNRQARASQADAQQVDSLGTESTSRTYIPGLRPPADEFEREVWRHFALGGDQPRTRRVASGTENQEYHYYQAIRARDRACLDCHQSLQPPFTGQKGDLMAVAKVSIPDMPTQRRLHWNRAVLASTAIITVVLAMVAAYVIVRYVIAKPLKHLRDVSDAISHGNIEKRAEIRTGDEFEELGRAFNRMLRHLVAVQEELRHVNADLDSKVDELAQANLALFEMNRLKSDFLATMSHELRTPLNSILGFSEVLGSIDSLDDRQRRYVRNIQKSGKMLLDMINDILDLAKIESGKMEVRIVDFRIEHVIAAQCDLARPLAEKKNIDLETSLAEDLPRLHQDQGKIQQILNNLLSNAIKFTPEGGRIHVYAGAPRLTTAHLTSPTAGALVPGDLPALGGQPRHLELVVSDTGVGIAEEDQEIIFEKFRQGNSLLPSGNAMTREYSGTGLGLSIVKELCKLLGGSITLESELGKGSMFTVRLPLALPEQPYRSNLLPGSLVDLTKARRIHFDRSENPAANRPTPASRSVPSKSLSGNSQTANAQSANSSAGQQNSQGRELSGGSAPVSAHHSASPEAEG